MEPEIVRKYIADNGFRTLSDLREHFADKEMLAMMLNFLCEKNIVWKIRVKMPNGSCEEIYYIPCSL